MDKLDRSAVQDENNTVYTEKSQSTVNSIYWNDKVRIRYDNNWFSNEIYYEGTPPVKKGEIFTYRSEQGSNELNLNDTNIKSGTIDNTRLPANISVTTLTGSGSNIIDIKGTNLIGTIDNARLPGNVSVATLTGSGSNIIDIKGTNLIGTIDNARLPANISVTTLACNGASITNLDSTKLTGTIDNARLPQDIKVGSLEGVGSNITNLDATKLTGTIDNSRITTTAKIYNNFNQTTFSIINDKMNLSPDVGSYTFNIISCDKMIGTTTPTYLLSDKLYL